MKNTGVTSRTAVWRYDGSSRDTKGLVMPSRASAGAEAPGVPAATASP
jgi:hypothetical protein